nr:hypothetical protein CFP56_16999 [Quercus suber]
MLSVDDSVGSSVSPSFSTQTCDVNSGQVMPISRTEPLYEDYEEYEAVSTSGADRAGRWRRRLTRPHVCALSRAAIWHRRRPRPRSASFRKARIFPD